MKKVYDTNHFSFPHQIIRFHDLHSPEICVYFHIFTRFNNIKPELKVEDQNIERIKEHKRRCFILFENPWIENLKQNQGEIQHVLLFSN